MKRENKLSVSSDTELQVYLVDVPFLSGLVAFHFKGSSGAYWTYIEALSDTAPVVQPSVSSVTASSPPVTAGDQKAAAARDAERERQIRKVIQVLQPWIVFLISRLAQFHTAVCCSFSGSLWPI
jgi:hypothetical protein